MIIKSASEGERIDKSKNGRFQVNNQNNFRNDNFKDKQNQDNLSNMLENHDFDLFDQQNSEFDIYDDICLYNDNYDHSFNNQKESPIKSNRSIDNSSYFLSFFNKEKDISSKNANLNIIDMKSNNSKSFQFQYFNIPYNQNTLNNNNFLNYDYQLCNYISKNKNEHNVKFQFDSNILNKKARKKRGTGDEAQRKHPNDDFNFENKPCYIFLVSIANTIFRNKCTFEIISKVANIVEQLNPTIEKRTRMEKRRKSVQLCWFHNNWLKIRKMKKAIIEQLSLIEKQNQTLI